MLTKKYFKTKDEAEVTFEFARNDVKSVSLYGDFNDWQAIEMKFIKKSQSFKTRVRLPKGGSYQFRYLLDNAEWENDHAADQYLANEFGSDNSVVTISS
ncbi:isoamylase early set domain-containing protein [Thalassotalea sp. ND16A]|uniref:isoamylase early set domain-containing protein n=1 Tax=Thalassotalea sp. ND16A TaxID=1535422 RepID=UPI00051A6EB2|nr:isoamylase early set domain-containing protein [Thalassotalea sp. ND16A]KGJ99667.1 hypothetical protein ND16A_3767 [Thalassotalea sp. ND16A]